MCVLPNRYKQRDQLPGLEDLWSNSAEIIFIFFSLSSLEKAIQVGLDRITGSLENGISGGIGSEGGKSLIDDLYG
jgi:hypothetical protein